MMKINLLFFLIFCFFILDIFINHDVSGIHTKNLHSKAKYLSTKTPYWQLEPSSLVSSPVGCIVVQTNFLIRHGTRNPSPKDISKIKELKSKILHELKENTTPWLLNLEIPYIEEKANLLVENGVLEMISLGQRIRKSFASNFPLNFHWAHYKFYHTWKPRTFQSASAFSHGFFNGFESIPFHVGTKENDRLLRFFDLCSEYIHSVQQNKTALEEYRFFRDSEMMQDVLKAFKEKVHSTLVDTEDMITAYTACSFDIAVFNQYNHWCSFFSKDMLVVLDFYKDLKIYWAKAYGHSIDWKISTPLLHDIYQSMKSFTTGKSTIKGHFRFAHAETLLPFISLLGLNWGPPLTSKASIQEIQNRIFKSSELAPFGGNMGFIMHQCSNSYKIEILLNEKQVKLPGCNGEIFCDLEKILSIFQSYLELYTFDKVCHHPLP